MSWLFVAPVFIVVRKQKSCPAKKISFFFLHLWLAGLPLLALFPLFFALRYFVNAHDFFLFEACSFFSRKTTKKLMIMIIIHWEPWWWSSILLLLLLWLHPKLKNILNIIYVSWCHFEQDFFVFFFLLSKFFFLENMRVKFRDPRSKIEYRQSAYSSSNANCFFFLFTTSDIIIIIFISFSTKKKKLLEFTQHRYHTTTSTY